MGDKSKDDVDVSSLNDTSLNISNATAGTAAVTEITGGVNDAGVEAVYLPSDDDMGKLEQAFAQKMKSQQQAVLKNADCIDEIEKELLSMNEAVEANDSVSSRVEKFGVLNRSLEKLKADIDDLLLQREHAQNSLSQLADKMAQDQKLIEAEQKRLEKGELSKEIEAYEKYLGITVNYEKVKTDDGGEETSIHVGFPELCQTEKPVYVKLKAHMDKDVGKMQYQAIKHEPELSNISELVDELNSAAGDWKTFTSKLRESFSKRLNAEGGSDK